MGFARLSAPAIAVTPKAGPEVACAERPPAYLPPAYCPQAYCKIGRLRRETVSLC